MTLPNPFTREQYRTLVTTGQVVLPLSDQGDAIREYLQKERGFTYISWERAEPFNDFEGALKITIHFEHEPSEKKSD